MISTIPAILREQFPAHLGDVTWHDLFCGAGGSSLGLHHVPGFKVTHALNHWDLAVTAHQNNFPETDHEITEIQNVHPSRFSRARCGWFSPSCTNHAYCRGTKDYTEEALRSRATMWDVCRWAEWHKYDVVVVENVIEIKLWCDNHLVVDAKGKTKGCSCGSSFDSWKDAMAKLGYVAQEVYLNSQHALVPQSRDRLYLVLTRVGIPLPDLDFSPPAYCQSCETAVAGVQTWKRPSRYSARGKQDRLLQWGRYGKQYLYTCPLCTDVCSPAVLGSWSIINHELPIDTVASRTNPPIVPNTRRRIRIGLERLQTLRPIQMQVGGNLYERPGYARVWSLDDPLRTVTATKYMAMVVPQKSGNVPTTEAEPAGTVTTRQHLSIIMRTGGQSPSPRVDDEPTMTNNVGRSTEEPAPPVTTGGNQMLMSGMTNGVAQPTEEPSPTVTASGKQMLVSLRNQGSLNESNRAPGEPVPTVAAGGRHHGLLVYNGIPGFLRVLDDAAGTVTARDKQSLLVPYNRTGLAHGDYQPLTTVTSKDRSALVEITEEDIDQCLFRMLHWTELRKAQWMHVLPDGSVYTLEGSTYNPRTGKVKDMTDEQRVRMIGNAVSSPVAEIIGHSIAQALAQAA